MSVAGEMFELSAERAKCLELPRPTSSRTHRVRVDRDPFDLWATPTSGSRQTEQAYALARDLAMVLGAGEVPAIVESYLEALSIAPVEHLRVLARRGARVVLAPTIAAGLTSPQLQERRRSPLTLRECNEIHIQYAPESLVGAIYDPETDTLVFPTAYCCIDLEHAVIHELGHALTWHQAARRTDDGLDLLRNLPFGIRRHVRNYDSQDDRLLEALAEAYTWFVVGREAELPATLASELAAMLSM